MPASAEPTLPAVAPNDTAETLRVSPLSTSLSLASTPAAAMVRPASSSTLPVSATAIGASLTGVTSIVSVLGVVSSPPAESWTENVNVA